MKVFSQLLVLLLASAGFGAGAQAADAPIVREVFSCNFNSGKDMDDLMSARDFFIKQSEKLGQDPREHFVWTPYKAGDFPADFLWFANSPDLVTFGKESDRYMNSPEGQAAEARFNDVATCTSTLAMRSQFYQGKIEFAPGPSGAVITSSACRYQHGHGPDDLEDLLAHVSRSLDAANLTSGFMGFVAQPVTGGSNPPDLYLTGVVPNVESWANLNMKLQAAGGPSLRRHFDTILDCESRLFMGQRVVPLPE